MTFDEITACLVTRGDVDLEPILQTLPYGEIIVYDNDPDLGVYGRYSAMSRASNPVVYTQDDDCIFRHHDDLLRAYEPGLLTAVYGHGADPCGYDDVALVHGGALVDRDLPFRAFRRYLEHFPADQDFRRDCDMVAGCLTPHVHVHLPYEIRMDVATRPNRMANQPWQRETKLRVTNRARWIRDHVQGPPRTMSYPVGALA